MSPLHATAPALRCDKKIKGLATDLISALDHCTISLADKQDQAEKQRRKTLTHCTTVRVLGLACKQAPLISPHSIAGYPGNGWGRAGSKPDLCVLCQSHLTRAAMWDDGLLAAHSNSQADSIDDPVLVALSDLGRPHSRH